MASEDRVFFLKPGITLPTLGFPPQIGTNPKETSRALAKGGTVAPPESANLARKGSCPVTICKVQKTEQPLDFP